MIYKSLIPERLQNTPASLLTIAAQILWTPMQHYLRYLINGYLKR